MMTPIIWFSSQMHNSDKRKFSLLRDLVLSFKNLLHILNIFYFFKQSFWVLHN